MMRAILTKRLRRLCPCLAKGCCASIPSFRDFFSPSIPASVTRDIRGAILSFEFRLKRRVHFYETDAAGIVHFSTYFRYMEEAEHALWRDAGLTIAQRSSDIGWPRVNVSFEYFRPLVFEQEFEAHIRIV